MKTFISHWFNESEDRIIESVHKNYGFPGITSLNYRTQCILEGERTSGILSSCRWRQPAEFDIFASKHSQRRWSIAPKYGHTIKPINSIAISQYLTVLSALQVMSLTASTGSLVAITIERYRAICLPFTPPLSKFQAKLAITLVSITSFLLALPEVGAYNLGPPFGCMEKFPTRTLRQAYSLLLFLVCYLLPLLFLVPAYTKMIFKLWHDRDDLPGSGVSEDSKNRKRKRNVLKMMAVVVTCYALCVLPTYSVFLWLDFGIGADGKPDTSRFHFVFPLTIHLKACEALFENLFPMHTKVPKSAN